MILQTTKSIGDFGERYAARYLMLHGYHIKKRNWRSGKYELDIVAETLRGIVFVEVKTRTYSADTDLSTAPPPSLAVHADKQHFTRTAAQRYLYEHQTNKTPRMDVIEIWLQKTPEGKRPKVLKINHMKAAY
ncbi:MAG: YraN family protein [Clostridia bacterium]|nr:YraN family protein [Clostridia bacterium]